MTFRPNKTASTATATEVRRVVRINDQDLAQTQPYARIDPLSIPEVKIWLRVDQASDSGTLTIPDACGGASATQATVARKPVVGTTGNGLAKLTCTDDYLILPLSAGNNNADWFGIGMWLKPSTVTGGRRLYDATTAASASSNRLRWTISADNLVYTVYEPGGVLLRTGMSADAVIATGIWKFLCFEINGALLSEGDKSKFKDGGTELTVRELPLSYAGSTATAPGTAVLNTPTGTSFLFAGSADGATGPYNGDIGPDIFFYDPRTMTKDKLVSLAQFRVPVG